MMAKGGMEGGMMEMAPMHCMGLSEPRLSGLKAELNITDRQLRAWNTFADAAKADPGPMPAGMMAMMMAKPLPERLAHHETMMKAHLKALHKSRTAVLGLYRVLTPEQRVMADKSLCGMP